MNPSRRIAFIGNSLPRRCGIATFTTDLQQAIAAARPSAETCIVAMNDRGQTYDYPPVVRFQVNDDKIDDYVVAADLLNAAQFDVVSLQHEFGIFGGESGGHITTLLSRLKMPIVTTLHTVLSAPTPPQRAALDGILGLSSKIVVMAEKGREMLRDVFGAPLSKLEVIPHGIPDAPFAEPDFAKARLGFGGRSVILTFGLLSPNKGVEFMIDAMPEIVRRRPDAMYVILGATHPHLVRDQGEAYRESLMSRVRDLGVQDHVVFLDQFVDRETLLGFISMCDVYVTPYLNEAQMTSGTLAYSFGMGKAVVSTPYWHAQELLADGRGVLVPFGDAASLGAAISRLLTDDALRGALQKRAYASSRSMTWEQTAHRYLEVFGDARRVFSPAAVAPRAAKFSSKGAAALPDVRLAHLKAMCDDTGLFQHAVHSVPDRSHGYCVDDNARALLLTCALNAPGERRFPEMLTGRFAAFIQHAWNPATRRFRNFMGFDRRWLEESGSDDSHGRTLWALGECARSDTSASRRRWAAALFLAALPAVESFRSPRAWAFTLLGLDAYCGAAIDAAEAVRMRFLLADRLMSLLAGAGTNGWSWFEHGLSYENARLPQALIVTGLATKTAGYVDAGLRSLRWLMTQQTSAAGVFRPVGTEGFADRMKPPRSFDQQPVEAAATVSACHAAQRADRGESWAGDAARAFAWFLGENDLSSPLVDPETGGCRDGLHRDRPNENRGGESVISYLLALCEMRQHARISENVGKSPFTPPRGLSSVKSAQPVRGRFVTTYGFESAAVAVTSRPGESDYPPVSAGGRAARPQPH